MVAQQSGRWWCCQAAAEEITRPSGSYRHPQKYREMSRSYRYCLDQKCDRKRCNSNITASLIYVQYFSGKVHSDLLLQWGSSLNLLAANNSNTVLILCEHLMSAHFSQQVAAVQLTPTQLSITQFATGAHLALQSEIHIKGVCVTKVSGIEK